MGRSESGHVCGLVGRWINGQRFEECCYVGWWVGEPGLSAVVWAWTRGQMTGEEVFVERLHYGREES